jgi:hypothetical protein
MLISGTVVDVSIHDPPIEEIIRQAFAEAREST